MPTYLDERKSVFTTTQLFELVADIEKYPEFLPWCTGARILSRDQHAILAQLMIGFNIFSDHYTSRVELTPPATSSSPGFINVTMVEGPFTHLENEWRLLPDPETGGSIIKFMLSFEFKKTVFKNLMNNVFEQAAKKMIIAFEERANNIYNGR